MNDISIILDRAAATLERKGMWIGGVAQGDEQSGATCAALAIRDAAGDYDVSWSAREFFASFIGAYSPGGGIYNWNDAPERTQMEVVYNLRAAAMLARDTDRSGEADETAKQAQPKARAGAEGIAQ